MESIIFKFSSLAGDYIFKAIKENELINYEIETNIEELDNKKGSISAKNFIEFIDAANIQRWDKEYPQIGSAIEDATKWSIEYKNNGQTYLSRGEEGYWPYYYENLIKAIKLCDEKADYFS